MIIEMIQEKKDFLTVYHTNLRNVGLFITISFATKNFNYTKMDITVLGKSLITLIFIIISFLLNIELLILVSDNEENIDSDNKYIKIIPYLTLLLVIILILKIVINILVKFKFKNLI
tara:strand:+ start:236 stop:586 length:351 start_codon:yes stop_codon:yes gene_type:complete